MIEIFETMLDIELALLIIGVFALILGVPLGYAMVHEYKMYLEEHRKARFSFLDFIKMGHFYIFLFLGTLLIMLANLLYFLE